MARSWHTQHMHARMYCIDQYDFQIWLQFRSVFIACECVLGWTVSVSVYLASL